MTTVVPRKILGRELARALHEAGLIPGELTSIRRVVIDLQPSEAAVMYIDYFADERWLDVVHTFDGIEIRIRETT
jgi:hypothetical protein